MEGLIISRQLSALASAMQEADYAPSLEDLFVVVANVEKVILFALKTNLPPTIKDTDLSRIHEGGSVSSNWHYFHKCCKNIALLHQFMHFPNAAHQQVLVEQGVLEHVFSILKVLTETLKKLCKSFGSLEDHDKALKKSSEDHNKTTRTHTPAYYWAAVRKNYRSIVKMARAESNKLYFGDVRQLCQLLFLAITAIFSKNREAEISASKEMSFILETLLTLPDLGANDCLTRMLDHNEYLLRNKVEKEHVELIVKVSKLLGSRWDLIDNYIFSLSLSLSIYIYIYI